MSAPWTKAAIRRAVQAVENEDRCVSSVEIWPDGRLKLLTRPRAEDVESTAPVDWTSYAGKTEVSRA